MGVVIHIGGQQVFYLECLLLFQIKSQPGLAYKSVDYKQAFSVVF